MQQSINTDTTHQNSKFDFFQKNIEETKPDDFIKFILATLFFAFTAISTIGSLGVSDYLTDAPHKEAQIKIDNNKISSSLFVSLNSKSLGDIQVSLNSLNKKKSTKVNIQSIDLLLQNPIYEKNQKKYSPEYKIMVSSYLLSITNDLSIETSNLYNDYNYKNKFLIIYKQDILNKKFNDSYFQNLQVIAEFKKLYLDLVNNIDDVKLQLVLQNHLDYLLKKFDEDLKRVSPS